MGLHKGIPLGVSFRNYHRTLMIVSKRAARMPAAYSYSRVFFHLPSPDAHHVLREELRVFAPAFECERKPQPGSATITSFDNVVFDRSFVHGVL